jgi:hypothetical protein
LRNYLNSVISKNEVSINLIDIINSKYVKNLKVNQKKLKEADITNDQTIDSVKAIPKGPVETDMRGICFEDIDDNFSYGHYANFEVIVMKKNGYINATKMCNFIREQTGGKKVFNNWAVNKDNILLKKEVALSVGIPVGDVYIPLMSEVANNLRGTYVHSDLIPHIAAWMSPVFAVKISKIINQFFLKQETSKNIVVIDELNGKIDGLNNIINKLNNKLDVVLKNNIELLKDNKKIKNDCEISKNNSNILVKDNKEIKEKLNEIVIERDIPSSRENENSVFILWRNNDDKTGKDRRQYHTMKFTGKNEKRLTNEYKKTYPNGEIILRITDYQHARNLWYRVRDELAINSKRIFIKSISDFNISKFYTENLLINDIRRISRDRFDLEYKK